MPQELIPIREAARRLGVSDTAVRKAIAAGRVTVAGKNPDNDRPLLAWPATRDQWTANSDSSKRSHVGGTGQSKERAKYDKAPAEVKLPVSSSGAGPASAPVAAPADEPADIGRSAASGPTYAASRAVREAYAARLQKLEYEERIGKLVNVDTLKMEAFKTHRRVRDAILNIPDRCAPHLATMTDTVEIHAYLLTEITEALRQLSADIYRPGAA